VTLDTLNNTSFVPASCDEDLHAGALQLPQGTLVLLSEGGLVEGTVSSKGVLIDPIKVGILMRARSGERSCMPRRNGDANPQLRVSFQCVCVPNRSVVHGDRTREEQCLL
jgi:hypothetical protein